MAHIKVDGDVWKVRLGQERPRPGVRLLLFLCQPTGQRPYRVVEVPEDRFDSQQAVERLSRGELLDLYRQSTSMDIPKLRSDEITDVRRRARG
ncbi:MAG: hypothetical protein AMS25_07725 [Gemmatimonas sp. SM23_52]|nr:MAG: hypothetical protein AMS25_07725 [Gemmatimonas sp. SM23_52]